MSRTRLRVNPHSTEIKAYDCTKNELLYIYFVRILPGFQAKLHSFLAFSEHLFYLITAYDSSLTILCNGLCDAVLHECRNY